MYGQEKGGKNTAPAQELRQNERKEKNQAVPGGGYVKRGERLRPLTPAVPTSGHRV